MYGLWILTSEAELSAKFDVRRNVVSPLKANDATERRFISILHIFRQEWEKIIKHHIEGGIKESHPCVQDLQHQRLT